MVNRGSLHGEPCVPRLETGGFCYSSWDFRDLVHGESWISAGSREKLIYNRVLLWEVHGEPCPPRWETVGSRGVDLRGFP